MKEKVAAGLLGEVSLCVLGAVTVETVDRLMIQPKTVASWSEIFQAYSERHANPPLPDFNPLAVYKQIQAGDFSFMTK